MSKSTRPKTSNDGRRRCCEGRGGGHIQRRAPHGFKGRMTGGRGQDVWCQQRHSNTAAAARGKNACVRWWGGASTACIAVNVRSRAISRCGVRPPSCKQVAAAVQLDGCARDVPQVAEPLGRVGSSGQGHGANHRRRQRSARCLALGHSQATATATATATTATATATATATTAECSTRPATDHTDACSSACTETWGWSVRSGGSRCRLRGARSARSHGRQHPHRQRYRPWWWWHEWTTGGLCGGCGTGDAAAATAVAAAVGGATNHIAVQPRSPCTMSG